MEQRISECSLHAYWEFLTFFISAFAQLCDCVRQKSPLLFVTMVKITPEVLLAAC